MTATSPHGTSAGRAACDAPARAVAAPAETTVCSKFPFRPASALLLLVTFVAALTGCNSGPVPAAEFVQQAEQLHRGALASTITRNTDLNDYFAEVGRRVVQGASDASGGKFRDPTFANMQFHLVGSETPNAFTTGGSHIYIYNGVFQLCESEEELAAVMAHEFAHAVDLDVQRTGMRPTPGDTLDRIAYLYVANALSPSLEDEADRRAFDFYARGGWDPSKYADVFARLQARGLDRPQAAPGALAGRGATLVPGIPLQARATAANALARNLPAASRGWRKATVADPQTFKDLRTRAASSPQGERSTPQNRSWLFLRAFPNCLLPTDLPDQQAAQQQLKRDITPVTPPTVIEPS
jgi:hypothetical protein